VRERLSDRVLIARFRRICARNSTYRTRLPGYAGIVDQVERIVANDDRRIRTIVHADLRDLFTNPVLRMLRPAVRRWPSPAARIMAGVMPTGFRWLVGPLRRSSANSVEIRQCRFLRECGEQACLRVCKRPTQEFFAEYVGIDVELDPDPIRGCCVIRFGNRGAPPERAGTLQASR